MTELMALQMQYGLPPSLARILVLLAENQVVTARMVELEHKLTKDAKVAIHRLRRRLEDTGVEIKSQRDVGYWVDAASRDVIRRVMKSDPTSLPDGSAGKGEAVA